MRLSLLLVTLLMVICFQDSDVRKKKDMQLKTTSNHSIAKSSSSPDAKVSHVSSTIENGYHQKHNVPLGNIQLTPIHDPDQHKENMGDSTLLTRSDTKMSCRTTLGLNISTPGGDLPLPSSQGHRYGMLPRFLALSVIVA